MVEQRSPKPQAAGSSPATPASFRKKPKIEIWKLNYKPREPVEKQYQHYKFLSPQALTFQRQILGKRVIRRKEPVICLSRTRIAEVVESGRHAILRGGGRKPVGVQISSSAPFLIPNLFAIIKTERK